MPPICSISIDLDPLHFYQTIHGQRAANAAPPEHADPIYTRALPRLLELFDELGVKATFFVIGTDLDIAEHRTRLAEAHAAGHELASHTERHVYHLPDLDAANHRDEIIRVHDRLGDLTGIAPVGFRAPGYNIDARTLELIETLGYTYDASIFPCPPYYLAKAAVMAALWLQRRPSGSSMIDPWTQLAPLRPYHPDRHAIHRRSATPRALVELPMCVLPGLRVPLIGTSLLLAGPRWSAVATRLASRYHRDILSLELHGIDVIDAEHDDVPAALRQSQPDLTLPLDHKLNTLRAVVEAARPHYQLLPCREAATAVTSMDPSHLAIERGAI